LAALEGLFSSRNCHTVSGNPMIWIICYPGDIYVLGIFVHLFSEFVKHVIVLIRKEWWFVITDVFDLTPSIECFATTFWLNDFFLPGPEGFCHLGLPNIISAS
jgi:hypothetical protein